ncbi:Acetyl esterase/lipase [Paenibacillus sp. 1_12]|uniref:alpha/beta hydrolase n=1 Tax=Paenibacillus sp. 1_12 TaxID=1566278 RepID=UPI0008EF7F84|nr:alpha/beta hydrolase [Paenibacillus sp. 1_12]SFL35528.1 Acetyl esterase/lipase [Paenibacillus sp. 1_12]
MSILLWPNGAPFAKGTEPEDCPAITPYLLQSDQPSPCMIICPGGGYRALSEQDGEPTARWLNQLGISAVVLKYRVAPYHHPCPLTDAQRAIRYIRYSAKEWNIDPQRIGILGFSSGGHLAATAGTHPDSGKPAHEDPIERESSEVSLMVLCYARITMLHYEHPYNANLMGPNPSYETRYFLSNEKHVNADTPPVFLWITADDQNIQTGHNLLFASALSDHKIPFEMHIFESGKHGLGLAEDHPSAKHWPRLCQIWLGNHGF